jgi:hypothetical protein
MCAMQNKTLDLAQKIATELQSENRILALDALDVAKILLRKQVTTGGQQSHEVLPVPSELP